MRIAGSEKKVVVVGDAAVDIIVHFPKFLDDEETKAVYKTPYLIGGGTAANTAVSLSRLGIETFFIGTIGDDQYGHHIVKDLQNEKINTKYMILDEAVNTVGVFAFIDKRGERLLWGWPREKQAFKKIDRDKIDFEMIKNADWIHSSGMAIVEEGSSRDTIIEIFKTAFEAGVPTSFDLNLRVKDESLNEEYRNAVLEVIKNCNYVLGSGEEEFYYLHPNEDWKKSVKSLADPNRTIIARMGPDGTMACSYDETIIENAFQVDVVDTVGAGDVFNGGFIVSILSGNTLKESLEIANAVSGYTVSRESARSSPNQQQLETFMKTHKKYNEINL
ncbi:carbohydrate kinase family protein [Oceanobacillus neutriphilus]|uniref:Sugar kinase n=1 Tax=Oceanobacillus neutriphilus TaxID=531815 RepID=A0ABQ2NV01_9BACI|nr:sugar kinase [Oceanobacillus neutriphilus]GGP11213.1 sugar kinase [Oceanobacillus neutriphilus]